MNKPRIRGAFLLKIYVILGALFILSICNLCNQIATLIALSMVDPL